MIINVAVDFGALTASFNPLTVANVAADAVLVVSEEYVPQLTGDLAKSHTKTQDTNAVYLHWDRPYARYVYAGKTMVYPVGTPYGWQAKKGVKKVATEQGLNYTKTYHPNASARWDQVALASKSGAAYVNHQVTATIVR
ncbi:minor capsid protein [Loigolactobacillus bifermentans]|uniref:Minor capsid protein n=1 Tax=Loigolactobacillus bifermentans DSM 20003 TaxID=1423726 RepID=A0A0R1GJY5_9LACO|nr:minor capsid protein [Loigolactobacillus bifermentans]KRK34383.1 hypothetical protein FC07_GL000591 [Loigolactobacillus bifermentans DSM 20003]QGG60087.1 hypothetical protein LB003_06280 [Loigolactobacillus bifermentans]